MTVRPIVAWFDLWVGVFIDRPKRRAYVFSVPRLGLVISWGEPLPDPRDELIRSLWLHVGRYEEKQLTTDEKELLYDITGTSAERWWRS